MKIDVVYEKQDLLKLVVEDLRRKGIKVKPGTSPTVKAPLEIKLAIEAEDDEVAAAPPTTEAKPPPEKAPNGGPPPKNDDGDMSEVLKRSDDVIMTSPGKFERRPPRPLGPNESLDYPEE